MFCSSCTPLEIPRPAQCSHVGAASARMARLKAKYVFLRSFHSILMLSKGPFPPAQAVNEFKKQFKSKAAVSWENRKGMTAKKGVFVLHWLYLTLANSLVSREIHLDW